MDTSGLSSSSTGTTAFILDFDGTITERDTISTLANLAIAHQKTTNNIDLKDTWLQLADTYTELYSRSTHGYKPTEKDRKTLAEEITFLRSLKDIELTSFNWVSKSGLFKGIGEETWRVFGRDAVGKGDVNVRRGLGDFAKRVGSWGIVSVNFSSLFIKGVLAASAGDEAAQVEVLANQPDEEGILLGPDGGPVMATSDAKLEAMNEVLRRLRAGSKAGFDKVVYIGDSVTDIECLTAEGVTGVVMSSDGSGKVMDALKRIGLETAHVDSQQAGGHSILWARNFDEITKSYLFSSENAREV